MMDYDLDGLPHPEDLSEIELIALYMRVYTQFVKTSTHITSQITGNPETDKILNTVAEKFEKPLSGWLERADEVMPDWWDSSLLAYPDFKETE